MAPKTKKKGSIDKAIQSGYRVRIKPKDGWHALNRNNMQEWVADAFKDAGKKTPLHSPVASTSRSPPPDPELGIPADTCSLFTHQHIIKDFMQPESPYRGLMLYHSLGSGKTRGSISIAEVLSSKYKVIVMVPASLAPNYTEEIRKCGNEIYRTTGKWSFITKANEDAYATEMKEATDSGVTHATIKRNAGVWVREPSRTSNYGTLSDEEQTQINGQIDDMIRSRYNFIHYNGLTAKSIKDLKESVPEGSSPFDGHLVIIDEVHNLVSRIVNDRVIGRSIYNMIMTAKNAKVILLSGTPIINRPVELAIIANMVRGYMPYLTLSASGVTSEQWQIIEDAVKEHPRVDYYELDRIKSTLALYPLTEGYEWADKDAFLIRRIEDGANATFLSQIEQLIRSLKIKLKSLKISEHITKLLSDKEKEFDSLFVNYSALSNNNKNSTLNPVVNANLLSRRLQGIVSYYESFDPSQFPSVAPTNIVKVPMSDEVFKTYMSVRQDEFAKEAKAKMKRRTNVNELNTGNIYRAFSRAMCNFSFPASIKRPYPSTIAKMKLDGVDDIDGFGDLDDDAEILTDNAGKKNKAAAAAAAASNNNQVMQQYVEQIRAVMKELKRHADDYLRGDGLEEYGPKYAAILDNLHNSGGHALVYSQFRNVEGLGILALVLQADGWVEFSIEKNDAGEWVCNMDQDDWNKPKYAIFSGDKEKNRYLMAAFNNDFDALPPKLHKSLKALNDDAPLTNLRGETVKLMMITQSGAEGISLKNVRQVHIMEPYWNEIRIKQVIGRAVRAGSHLALPPSERHVDVFSYMTVFSDKQLKNATVAARENSQTSDEYIYGISLKKSRITNQLLDIVKSSAIDCLVHKGIHKNVQCMRYPSNFGVPIKGVLYSYRGANEDPSDETIAKQTRLRVAKGRRIGFVRCSRETTGAVTRIPYYKDTMEALHPQKFIASEGKDKVVIGRVVVMEDGHPKVVVYEEDEGSSSW